MERPNEPYRYNSGPPDMSSTTPAMAEALGEPRDDLELLRSRRDRMSDESYWSDDLKEWYEERAEYGFNIQARCYGDGPCMPPPEALLSDPDFQAMNNIRKRTTVEPPNPAPSRQRSESPDKTEPEVQECPIEELHREWAAYAAPWLSTESYEAYFQNRREAVLPSDQAYRRKLLRMVMEAASPSTSAATSRAPTKDPVPVPNNPGNMANNNAEPATSPMDIDEEEWESVSDSSVPSTDRTKDPSPQPEGSVDTGLATSPMAMPGEKRTRKRDTSEAPSTDRTKDPSPDPDVISSVAGPSRAISIPSTDRTKDPSPAPEGPSPMVTNQSRYSVPSTDRTKDPSPDPNASGYTGPPTSPPPPPPPKDGVYRGEEYNPIPDWVEGQAIDIRRAFGETYYYAGNELETISEWDETFGGADT